ncbi:MAG: SDR family oxidoreductase [Halobacteriales archaeon]
MAPAVEPPRVTAEAIHRIDDDRFTPETVAIVTGAASGIGEATAIAVAGNGMTALATDVDADGLASTVAQAEALGLTGRVESLVADLTVDEDLEAIVATADDVGTVRFLANIAGLQQVASLESFPMDVYDELQAVMVRAPVYLAREALPRMREAGGGCVGNMASVHGHYVTRDKVAYNVAKFAIRGLTQSIAAEGDGDVRSFSVSTGYVATPLVTGQLEDTAEQRGLTVDEVIEEVMLGQSRVKEMMAPMDVANLFVFGFSDLSSHLNGGDLLFDGGMTLTYE